MPKLKAIIDARGGGLDERVYVRGDKKVDYGTMMRVMGRLSAAGYHRVALVTEVEQGGDEAQSDHIGHRARRADVVGAGRFCRKAKRSAAD